MAVAAGGLVGREAEVELLASVVRDLAAGIPAPEQLLDFGTSSF